MRLWVAVITAGIVAGCSSAQTHSESARAENSELLQRHKLLEQAQADFGKALEGEAGEHPLTRFERYAQMNSLRTSPYDWSYNPELQNQGYRVGADGKFKSIYDPD